MPALEPQRNLKPPTFNLAELEAVAELRRALREHHAAKRALASPNLTAHVRSMEAQRRNRSSARIVQARDALEKLLLGDDT